MTMKGKESVANNLAQMITNYPSSQVQECASDIKYKTNMQLADGCVSERI